MGVLVRIAMPYRTAQSKDVAINNFVFGGIDGSGLQTDYQTIVSNVVQLYTTTPSVATTRALGSTLSQVIDHSAGACSAKVYALPADLSGATPMGSPIYVSTFTMPAAMYQAVPEEVAVCCTFEAAGRASQQVERADGIDPGTAVDRPRQRYTGRIYWGPLGWPSTAQDQIWTQDATNGSCKLHPDLIRDLTDGLKQLGDSANLIPGVFWGVWSRSDRAIREIDNIAVDNAFDTQRRRGISATTKTRVAAVGVGTPNVELAS
jgi:hypothetical protein